MLKPLGYATRQFGKNHLGDKNEFLPTVHGFDEFFGTLYHLNAEDEPELPNWLPADDFPKLKTRFGPRGVIHSWRRPTRTTRRTEFLATFKDFPPRQRAASFTIDQAEEKLEAVLTTGH